MKYYLIKCKCGHVGRKQYLAITFPVAGIDMKTAIEKVRQFGGVKKDHKDWCLEKPVEIDKEQFLKEKEKIDKNPYYLRKTKKIKYTLLADILYEEPKAIKQSEINEKIEQNKLHRKQYRKAKSLLLSKIDKKINIYQY